jgi:Branched-chain amino acid ATP-binding cassette transporter
VAHGPPAEVKSDPRVAEAYLGREANAEPVGSDARG